MEIGVFSRTFEGSAREVFGAIRAQGLRHTHLNLLTAGMETMPRHVDEKALKALRNSAAEHGLILDGLSGTFNMIAPDREEREDGIERFRTLCHIACLLETPMISLCTGSRSLQGKWTWDERNLLPDAWEDLLRTTERILPLAEQYDLILGVEPETANVINTPQRARLYLDAFGSRHLKIIMDGANLFLPGSIARMKEVLDEAFDLLGGEIIQAHAKDLAAGEGGGFVAPGEGVLDYRYYVNLLARHGYRGPLMMHGLTETQVKASVTFLRGVLSDA